MNNTNEFRECMISAGTEVERKGQRLTDISEERGSPKLQEAAPSCDRALTQDMILRFSRHLRWEEKSDATHDKYMRDVRRFADFTENRSVTKELVTAWKKELVKMRYAVTSINSMLASVNSLFLFLGWYDCKVKNIRLQRKTYCAEDKELRKEEYMQLLALARENTRLYLVIQAICSTGIRVSELQYFTVEAVRTGEITVNCKSKTRTILVPGRLKDMLLLYAKQNGITTGPIFVGKNGKAVSRNLVWRWMKQLCRKAGIQESKVFPHNLRKLFARTYYGTEKNIAELADILGHSSINTTRIYIMTTGVEHRRKIENLGLII